MEFKKSSMRASPISFVVVLVTFFIIQNPSVEALNGDVTYYYEWAWGYGSCGLDISKRNPFYVAALSRKYMNMPPGMTNPNNHPLCAPSYCIQLYGPRGSIIVKVSDTCEGCRDDDVDIADAVYGYLDDQAKGRVKMNWNWVNCQNSPPGRVW